jgi:hypothetical protein
MILVPASTLEPTWRRTSLASNARQPRVPPVLPAPHPARTALRRAAPRLWASRGPPSGATMVEIGEAGVATSAPPTRAAAVVDDGANGAESDREGVEAVLRQGWAGGLGRRAW